LRTTTQQRQHGPGLRLCAAAALAFLVTGCGKKERDPAAEAPPKAAAVVPAGDPVLVHVDRPQDFPLVSVAAYQATSALDVTGQVTADPSREIPVVALANGRVVATHVRLGDYVHKGQLIMEVQSNDIAQAFNQYLKAVNDERLARTVLDRDRLLFDKGAIAQSQVEIAQDAEDDALADLRAAEQQLRVLGVDKNHPGETVKVLSPASGFIIQQNVTEASTAGVGLSGSSNAFVIADLTHVWVLCDVYENDLAQVHVGQSADIGLAAYPDLHLTGTVGDIGALLDPNLRTGKVRIQVPNPGYRMRVGMFATAVIHGRTEETHAQVPATAILHLHDRDWVYVPASGGATAGSRAGSSEGAPQFRRVAVVSGAMLAGGMQEVNSGLSAGQQVVRNALELQNTAAQ
jgi:membrane fusion protein, heavy metal efflux system